MDDHTNFKKKNLNLNRCADGLFQILRCVVYLTSITFSVSENSVASLNVFFGKPIVCRFGGLVGLEALMDEGAFSVLLLLIKFFQIFAEM